MNTTSKEPLTRVIFRKYRDGEIIALFPDMDEGRGMIGSYMHIGQHSEADRLIVVDKTKPAKPKEYAELKAELQRIGYRLTVRKRMIYRRF